MTKDEYRQACVVLNPAFITEIVTLSKLTGAEYATKAHEIRRRFGVDAPSVAALLRTKKDAESIARGFEGKTVRPRYLKAPGFFIWKRGGSELRDMMLGHDRRNEMFDWADIWIPVYEDSTKKDLDELWAEIRSKRLKHEKEARVRPGQLQKKVEAFLYFRRHGTMRGLTQAIGAKNQKEAERALQRAWMDIMRSPWPGVKAAKERLIPFSVSPLEIHILKCSFWKQGKPCKDCERLLNEQTGARWGEVVPTVPGVPVDISVEGQPAKGKKKPATR